MTHLILHTQAQCVLAKLMQDNFFKATLNKFIGTNKPIDLTFKLDPLSSATGTITYGNTAVNPPTWASAKIDLTLNETILPQLSGIEVALTLLHEGIHAEILRVLLSIHGPNNLTSQNFPSMFNLYADYKLSQGFSHEYIANYYVGLMSAALKSYDNNKFGDEYYRALAWKGLEGTSVWNNKNLDERTQILTKAAALLANRSTTNCDDI